MRVVDTFLIGNKERYYHSHSAENHDLKLQVRYIGNLAEMKFRTVTLPKKGKWLYVTDDRQNPFFQSELLKL